MSPADQRQLKRDEIFWLAKKDHIFRRFSQEHEYQWLSGGRREAGAMSPVDRRQTDVEDEVRGWQTNSREKLRRVNNFMSLLCSAHT